MFANKWHPTIGPVEQITSAISVVNEGTVINVLGKFCIYEETYNHNELKDKSTSTFCYNRRFETIVGHKHDS
jgi:hypothetical protein